MVSETEKNIYKEVLGRHYSNAVLTVLKEQGVLNAKRVPYSANDIWKVMGGFEENHAIENAILVAYQNKKKELQDFENKKNKLLNNQLAS